MRRGWNVVLREGGLMRRGRTIVLQEGCWLDRRWVRNEAAAEDT